MTRTIGAVLVTTVSIAFIALHIFPLTSISTISYEWVDADLFLWNFWWTKHALTAGQNPYWTDLLLYPTGASLALHTFPMPYNLLTLPVQAALTDVRGLAASFNLIVLLSTITSGLGAYFLSLRVTKSVPASVVAGVVFVCVPYRVLNVSRLHVIATEFLAWYAWAWVGFIAAPTKPRAILIGALLALAFYTSPEYALHAAGFSLLWLLWMRRPFERRIAIAAIVFLVIASPLLVMQARTVARGEAAVVPSLESVGAWGPALASFVTPSRLHPIYGGLLANAGDYGTPGKAGMRSETSIALTIWALALLAVLNCRRDGSQFWCIAAGVFLLLTLGPYLRLTGTTATHVPLPYAALYWLVPPLHFARDPTRFFAISLLMLSVVSAFGARALLERLRGAVAAYLAPASIAGLVIFEGLTVQAPAVKAEALIGPAYDAIAAATGRFAVLDLSPDQTALLAQTRHVRPITSGRKSNPRSAGASLQLDIERDFAHARDTLALPPDALELRLASNRQELDRLQLRFVVFPAGDPAQVVLAQRLGLRVSTVGEHVVCERF